MLVKFSGVESERTISKFKKKKKKEKVGEKKKMLVLCSRTPSTLGRFLGIRTFHVAVTQRRLRNVKKNREARLFC